MLRNYLITAIRFLTKNQLFTSINAIGLAVSISCTMLIYLYVKNEFTFDEFHEDIDRLYILGEGSRESSPDVNNIDTGYKDQKAASQRLQGILNYLEQNRDVLSVSTSQNVPGRYWENYDGFIPEGGTEPVGLRQANVDDHYLHLWSKNPGRPKFFQGDCFRHS